METFIEIATSKKFNTINYDIKCLKKNQFTIFHQINCTNFTTYKDLWKSIIPVLKLKKQKIMKIIQDTF